jgi:hypothetical protein
VSVHLGSLARDAGSSPLADLFGETVPDELVGDQSTGCADAWVRQAMDHVENCAAPVGRDDWARVACGDVAQESEARSAKRNILETKSCDGCAVGLDIRVCSLVIGHCLVVDTRGDSSDAGPGQCVSHRVVLASHVLDVCGILGDGHQVPLLVS